MAKAVVDMGDICRNVTIEVKVKGIKGFQARLWLTQQILKLAARVSRFQICFKGWSNEADIIG